MMDAEALGGVRAHQAVHHRLRPPDVADVIGRLLAERRIDNACTVFGANRHPGPDHSRSSERGLPDGTACRRLFVLARGDHHNPRRR